MKKFFTREVLKNIIWGLAAFNNPYFIKYYNEKENEAEQENKVKQVA